MDKEKRCLKCQSLLVDDDDEYGASIVRAPRYTVFHRIRDGLEGLRFRLSRIIGWHRITALPTGFVPFRLPLAAGTLTLLCPGAGQLYNRQPAKALVYAGAFWAWILFCIVTIHHPLSNLFLFGAILGWCGLWNDAYVTAVRINGQEVRPRHALALLFGILALFFASITLIQFLGGVLLPVLMLLLTVLVVGMAFQYGRSLRNPGRQRLVRSSGIIVGIGLTIATGYVAFAEGRGTRFIILQKILSDVHSPVIKSGDIVLTEHLTYRLRMPRRGEVLQFDPPRFTIEATGGLMNTLTSVNIGNYFQRVVAIEGDVVERRGGVCYVNGKALAPAADAFGASVLGDHAPFKVPVGKVYAPITRIPGDTFQALAEALNSGTEDRVNLPGRIYKGLEQANLPGRAEWLARALYVVNPPPRRCRLTLAGP
jgi:signal peptidase I/TM2 domain-containing membrane protein YozV